MTNTKPTLKETRPWVAMFIDLPGPLDPQCERLLTPLSIVRVKDVDQATERLLEVRPLLVVGYGDDNDAVFGPLRERCTDGQVVLRVLPFGCTVEEAEMTLGLAFQAAEALLE